MNQRQSANARGSFIDISSSNNTERLQELKLMLKPPTQQDDDGDGGAQA